MSGKRFLGWYFKHQSGKNVISFIPGVAESGAFLQMITPDGSRQFHLPALTYEGGCIRAGNCLFTPKGCQINLPGVTGVVRYGTLIPLQSDIMGPFRLLPMACRHGVISMAHTLCGTVDIGGRSYCFDGGTGYIETDSGTSFPDSYLWMQCNAFSQPCAFMLSIAAVPFFHTRFTGCICALLYGGKEYRFATYHGVRIHTVHPSFVCLSQGDMLLLAELRPHDAGHALRAPVRGKMKAEIRECLNAHIRLRLWIGNRQVFDLRSSHAAYESVRRLQ